MPLRRVTKPLVTLVAIARQAEKWAKEEALEGSQLKFFGCVRTN